MKFGKIKQPIYSRSDKRGVFFELISFGKWETLIIGKMKKGAQMGHHYHQKTIVFYYLLSGRVKIITLNLKNNKKCINFLNSHQGYIFRPEEVRIIKYEKNSRFIMLKSKKYNEKQPDLIKFEKETGLLQYVCIEDLFCFEQGFLPIGR